jgi:hypothetical protein
MELRKVDLLTVSFVFFLHGAGSLVLVWLFNLNHPIYTGVIVAFFILGLFYSLYHGASVLLPIGSGFLLFLPSVAYMIFIFSMSSMSRLPQIGVSGNCFHPIEYLNLSFLLVWALNKGVNCEIERKTSIIALLVCIIYALSDEFHQYFVPGRHVSVLDIALDSLGAMLGLAVFRTYRLIGKRLLAPQARQDV